MTILRFDWISLIAPTTGGALAIIPTYFLYFRQMMSNKDSVIEALREQNRTLDRERLPIVIQEKQRLVEDIEARAREKQETEKAMNELLAESTKTMEDVVSQTQNAKEMTGKIHEIAESVPKRKILDESLGLILGAKILQESYIKWHSLLSTLPRSANSAEFDSFLRGQFLSIVTVLNRVRTGGELIKIEEVTPDPGVIQRIAEITETIQKPASGADTVISSIHRSECSKDMAIKDPVKDLRMLLADINSAAKWTPGSYDDIRKWSYGDVENNGVYYHPQLTHYTHRCLSSSSLPTRMV
jgi:hypothetical protein